jgi:type IV pilus assembly protein PilA
LKKGFTLIELLIVVAIIGILASVGIQMYKGYLVQAQEARLEETCSNVRTDIESAIFYCKLNPDKTLPILSTTQKIPCSWGGNGIALYMYQKWTAIAKKFPNPKGGGELNVVNFNRNGMPERGGPGLHASSHPVSIKYVYHIRDYKYIELTCTDFYNPPYAHTVYNFEREYTN